MNFINHPELNQQMRSGGNENTYHMRVARLTHPSYAKSTVFLAAPFEFDEEEKMLIKMHLSEEMSKANMPLTSDQLDKIVASLPPIWLNQMHGWMPVILSPFTPFQMGYEKVILPVQPQDN